MICYDLCFFQEINTFRARDFVTFFELISLFCFRENGVHFVSQKMRKVIKKNVKQVDVANKSKHKEPYKI